LLDAVSNFHCKFPALSFSSTLDSTTETVSRRYRLLPQDVTPCPCDGGQGDILTELVGSPQRMRRDRNAPVIRFPTRKRFVADVRDVDTVREIEQPPQPPWDRKRIWRQPAPTRAIQKGLSPLRWCMSRSVCDGAVAVPVCDP
jgi:hypothetical protein